MFMTLTLIQEDGIKNIELLDKSLSEFVILVNAGDKQQVPLKQREALELVGFIEEDMVKGPPFGVPTQYADLPTLKVHAPDLPL